MGVESLQLRSAKALHSCGINDAASTAQDWNRHIVLTYLRCTAADMAKSNLHMSIDLRVNADHVQGALEC